MSKRELDYKLQKS